MAEVDNFLQFAGRHGARMREGGLPDETMQLLLLRENPESQVFVSSEQMCSILRETIWQGARVEYVFCFAGAV